MRIFGYSLALILGALAMPWMAHAASATPKVVLLTSVQTPKSLWHSSSWSLPATLESDFRKAFGSSGYVIEVKHDATAYDLAQELESPENIAVFWVSHAASTSGQSSALGLDNLIADEDGIDVSGVFQKVHPNLRWLGVVGCKAKPILDQYTQDGDYAGDPNLHIHSYSTVIDAEHGLIDSMNQSVAVIADPYRSDTYTQIHYNGIGEIVPESRYTFIPTVVASAALVQGQALDQCPSGTGFPITLTRTPVAGSSGPMVEAQIYVEDKFLGVMPASSSVQTLTINLPQGLISSGGGMNLKVDSPFAGVLQTRPEFGKVSFQSALPSEQWSIFADSSGNPIGITNELYRYLGDLSPVLAPQNQVQYRPFQCL
jgi:hypothetical protein